MKNAPLATNTSVDRVSKIRIFFSPNMSKKVPIVVVQMASKARKPYTSFERHRAVLLLNAFDDDLFVGIVGYFMSKAHTSKFVKIHHWYTCTYALFTYYICFTHGLVWKKKKKEIGITSVAIHFHDINKWASSTVIQCYHCILIYNCIYLLVFRESKTFCHFKEEKKP